MAQTERTTRPQFSQPFRQISLMLIVLALTGFGAFLALPSVYPIFAPNPYLNGVIVFVFLIGVIACFYQVFQLIGSVKWIESILESVSTRIDEAREITRYIVNMLIFLGLLGTFYGLATTVPAVVDTIRSLAPSQGDGDGGVEVFGRLMTGLEAQLGGMGVAFGSSLLGLAGSLVVGLLELFAGHGQNRFYQELEDWLSSITRVGFAGGDEASGDNNAMAGVIDQMSEQFEGLQIMLREAEANRAVVDEKLGRLTDTLDLMTRGDQQVGGSDGVFERIAAGQERMISALEGNEDNGDGMDAESRMRLRSIDVQMLRILEEISAGRQETMAELRQDIGLLAKAMSGSRTAGASAPARRVRPLDTSGGGER